MKTRAVFLLCLSTHVFLLTPDTVSGTTEDVIELSSSSTLPSTTDVPSLDTSSPPSDSSPSSFAADSVVKSSGTDSAAKSSVDSSVVAAVGAVGEGAIGVVEGDEAAPTDQLPPVTIHTNPDNEGRVGVFLNFTRELVNYTNINFHKEANSDDDDETDQEDSQDVRIQDLLRGILADEFGSEEVELNDTEDSDEFDAFQDESEETNEEDGAPSSTSSTTVESIPDSTNGTSQNATDDDGDNEEVAEDFDDKLARIKEEAEAEEVTGSGRTSRSDDLGAISGDEDDDRESRSRELRSRRRGSGKGKANRRKGNNPKVRNTAGDSAKYNRYVDAVFKRMNTLIRSKRMDPLRVNLYAGNSNGGQAGSNSKVSNSSKGTKVKKSGSRGPGVAAKPGKRGGHKASGRINNKRNNRRNGLKPIRQGVRQPGNVFQRFKHRQGRSAETPVITKNQDQKIRPNSKEALANKTTTVTTPSTTTTTELPEPSNVSSESKEMKGSQGNSGRPTRGVLHGLSTLRRTGPVRVVRRGSNTRLVRTKFLLGPVALEILPKKSNSTKSSSTPMATATARSLKGVLEIRLKNTGPTKIRRLRVFPPSNVRVEGESNGMKKQGYRRITPVAARRLMSVANQVVRQSDRHRSKPKSNTKNKKPGKKQIKRRNQQKNKHNRRN